MNSRQEAILSAIIGEYIRTGEPVGSHWVVQEGDFDVSPATIRNEMNVLNNEGFLEQPHTSAGRIPTEEAFHFYLEHFLEIDAPSERVQRELAALLRPRRVTPSALRTLVKRLSAIAEEAALVGWGDDEVYVSGIAQLLRQREFDDPDVRLTIARAFDDCESVVAELASDIEDEIAVLIGSSNPFGREYGAVVTKLEKRAPSPLLGIVGPVRMDYGAAIGLLQQLHRIVCGHEAEVRVW